MKNRRRSFARLVAAVLATAPAATLAQDTPLYRDPSPGEGPRVEGPLLAPILPRPNQAPPPPSGLGPFQPSNTGDADPIPEPAREPLLGVPPIPPPQPAYPVATIRPGGDFQFRRKTTIRPPNGPIGRCHEWIREALFGPPRPPTPTVATLPRRSFLARWSQPELIEADAPPPRVFKWPSWPTWPASGDR